MRRAQGLRGVGARLREHHDELVAAEPSRFRAVRNGLHEHPRDLVQERVAELVPGPVVDLLEVVTVDDEQADRQPPLLCERQLAIETLLEAAAIENPGERVRDRALPLASQRDRGVERCGYVGREQRGAVELDRVDPLAGAADRDERSELRAVRTEREPDERARAVRATWRRSRGRAPRRRWPDQPWARADSSSALVRGGCGARVT